MVIPHQTRKWVTPFVLFGFKTTTTLRPHKTKNSKILNHHHLIGRTKTSECNVTWKQKDNKKILAMNNKVLVCTGSLGFFKKYQQPMITIHETVQITYVTLYRFRLLSKTPPFLVLTGKIKMDGIPTKIKWKIHTLFTLYLKFWKYFLK